MGLMRAFKVRGVSTQTAPTAEVVDPKNPASRFMNGKKTILGAVLIAVLLADEHFKFLPNSGEAILAFAGTTIFGIGFAHKLDKLRAMLVELLSKPTVEIEAQTVEVGKPLH